MKYLSVPTITRALHRIFQGNTNEHRTSSATSGLLHNYFSKDKYIITPEQIQYSQRIPDYTIEKLKDGELVPPFVCRSKKFSK